jgi:hypothetical protein
MGNDNQAIALGTNHWTNIQMANDDVHPVTGKEMENMALMKDPVIQPLWKRGFGNKVHRLFQGICDIQGTNTCFLIDLKNVTRDIKFTYEKIVYDYKPHKKGKYWSDLQWVATCWIIPEKWQPPPWTSLHSKSLSTAHYLQNMLK